MVKSLFNFNTSTNDFANKIKKIFSVKKSIDPAFIEEIEEVLLSSDIGYVTSKALLEKIEKAPDSSSAFDMLKIEMKNMMSNVPLKKINYADAPTVIVFVGVNGAGKTTALAKLSYLYAKQGKKVFIAAADTFRAAAVQQLQQLVEFSGANVIHQGEGADPSAVVFDAILAAKASKADFLLVDSAGRLQANSNLMQELGKVIRTIKKAIPDAPHQTFLVVDASCGQNAISQARIFKEIADVSGVILNKLDGSARGGVALAICKELNLPICYSGVGENIQDLLPFDPDAFIESIFA